MKKRKGKKKNCVYKSKTNINKHLMFAINATWPYVPCRATLGRIPYKVYMFVIFLSMISRATSSFIFLLFISPLSSTRPRFKNRRLFQRKVKTLLDIAVWLIPLNLSRYPHLICCEYISY